MKLRTKTIAAVFLSLLLTIFMAGCGHKEADNSIDGKWYVYDKVEGSDTYGQLVATLKITYDDDTGYHIRLATTDGKLYKNYKGVWYEDERRLEIDDGINLRLSWFEYNIAGHWPIRWVLDTDGTGNTVLSTFGTKQFEASRHGYPHRLLHYLTGW